MDIVALEASSSLWNISLYKTRPKPCLFRLPTNKILLHCTTGGPTRFTTHNNNKIILHSRNNTRLATSVCVKSSSSSSQNHPTQNNVVVGGFGFDLVEVLVKKGLVLAAVCCGVFLVLGCHNKAAVAVAAEEVLNGGGGNYVTAGLEQIKVSFANSLPKILMVLKVLKEQGLILAALFGLSAFFSMAETSITTLWPWKVRELADKESENGVFKMLRNDVTRFLTTILIGTTVVNIGATALVTEAATTIFGEAGVSAATGVMTVAVLLLTEITPKSIAVHNATEVARVVADCMAFIGLVSCWKSCNISINGNAQVAWS